MACPPMFDGRTRRTCALFLSHRHHHLTAHRRSPLFRSPSLLPSFTLLADMSAHDNENEELIDYEDEHDVVTNGAAAPSAGSGVAATAGHPSADSDDKDKFSGIHSTGFRCVLASLGQAFVPDVALLCLQGLPPKARVAACD